MFGGIHGIIKTYLHRLLLTGIVSPWAASLSLFLFRVPWILLLMNMSKRCCYPKLSQLQADNFGYDNYPRFLINLDMVIFARLNCIELFEEPFVIEEDQTQRQQIFPIKITSKSLLFIPRLLRYLLLVRYSETCFNAGVCNLFLILSVSLSFIVLPLCAN